MTESEALQIAKSNRRMIQFIMTGFIGVSGILLWFLADLRASVNEANKAISQLNVTAGVTAERLDHTEEMRRSLRELESRLRELEIERRRQREMDLCSSSLRNAGRSLS
jgi:hypothetical protein